MIKSDLKEFSIICDDGIVNFAVDQSKQLSPLEIIAKGEKEQILDKNDIDGLLSFYLDAHPEDINSQQVIDIKKRWKI